MAGGWQEAEAKLGVVDARHVLAMSWNCNVKIGMPLRAQEVGPIGLGYAASVAADVANKAAKRVITRRPEWLPALFCIEFGREMTKIYKDEYDKFGAKVQECRSVL